MDAARAIVEHVLDHVMDGGLVVDLGGQVVFANADTERVFARSREALLGADLQALFTDLPPTWASAGRSAWTVRRSDGSLLSVRATVKPLGDTVAITLQDRATASPMPAMPASHVDPDATLVSIADAVDAFLFAGEMDVDSGWYLPIFHGPGMDALLGGEVEYEDANRIFDGRIFPEDYPSYEALYELDLRQEGVPMEATYRLRGFDGRVRWLRERSVARRVDGRWLLLGVIFDVSEEVERTAEIERERAERLRAVARFERVVSLSNDLILATDEDGLVCFAKDRKSVV